MYELHLEEFEGVLGINVSGGTDSALLLYLLMKNYSGPIRAFTTANMQKKCTNAMISVRVSSQCQQLTGHTDFEHFINYRNQQEDSTVFSTVRQYYNSGKIDRIYTAITKNPPKLVTDSFTEKTTEDIHRNPETFRDVVYDTNKFRPFTNLDKQDIAKIYHDNDLMENLFPLTRSCEWWSIFPYPDPGLDHCGKCWWCQERSWGFGKL